MFFSILPTSASSLCRRLWMRQNSPALGSMRLRDCCAAKLAAGWPAMTMQTVEKILTEIRPEFTFQDSHDFIADGMLDSFDLVLLVSALDKQFGISIEGREILPHNFCNLEAIGKLLGKYGVQV